jgi:indole-3-glycerol phosphate synthase/phosphoribosylanthranilate isomerase
MSRFRDALAGRGISAVAEVKRRSPSAGELRPSGDAAALASSFERAGAAAVSILVDERFGGSVEDLRAARAATSLPLLAKGFFRHPDELEAMRRAGADAVLLILRDLDDLTASRLRGRAGALGMDALVEVHDVGELRRAVRLGADPIGVNARDLGTFRIDLRSQLELVARAPRDRVVIAESGVEHRAHVIDAELSGADAVLIGSALMRAPEPAAALEMLMARPVVKVCGVTRPEDVAAAAEAGADLIGFVLAPSPRRVIRPLAVPEAVLPVSVVVGDTVLPPPAGLLQAYADLDGRRSREAMLLRGSNVVGRVLDLPPGGDDPGHWARTHDRARLERVVLAGGLGPDNVGRAVEAVRPWGVDAARGLETSPGVKDAAKMRSFVAAARAR